MRDTVDCSLWSVVLCICSQANQSLAVTRVGVPYALTVRLLLVEKMYRK